MEFSLLGDPGKLYLSRLSPTMLASRQAQASIMQPPLLIMMLRSNLTSIILTHSYLQARGLAANIQHHLAQAMLSQTLVATAVD